MTHVCWLLLAAAACSGFVFPSAAPRTSVLLVRRSTPLDSSQPNDAAPINDDDDDDDDEPLDAEALRELFVEAVQQGDTSISLLGDETTASLDDLDEAQFKLLMLRRLGQQDYDRIFKHPRVELELS